MKPNSELSGKKYGALAATYDRQVRHGEGVRRAAVEKLALRVGDVALDVGCGTGLSLPLLEAGARPQGKVIGVEASPEMLARARGRVEANGWTNVTLIEATAEEARLPEAPDAVLFHFVHDITRSPAAVQNIFGQVKPGARVAVAGVKRSVWWAVPVNLYMWQLARRYVTTFEGFDRPWSHIRRFVPGLTVRSLRFGAVFVAWGTASPALEVGS